MDFFQIIFLLTNKMKCVSHVFVVLLRNRNQLLKHRWLYNYLFK